MILLAIIFGFAFAEVKFQPIVKSGPSDVAHSLLAHGDNIYAADSELKGLHIIDAKTKKTAGKVLLNTFPNDLASCGNEIAVGTFQENTVSIINPKYKNSVKNLRVGPELLGANAVTCAGRKLYAADMGVQKILEIDLEARKIEKSFASGSGPFALSAIGDRLLALATYNITSSNARTLRLFQISSGKVLGEMSPTSAYGAITAGTDGKFYATNFSDQALLTIDINTRDTTKIPLQLFSSQQAMTSVVWNDNHYILIVDRGSVAEPSRASLSVVMTGAQGPKLVSRFTFSQIEGDPIKHPRGIAAGKEGEVFVESEGLVSVLTGIPY